MILKQFRKLYTRSAEAGEGRIKNMIHFFIKATNWGKLLCLGPLVVALIISLLGHFNHGPDVSGNVYTHY